VPATLSLSAAIPLIEDKRYANRDSQRNHCIEQEVSHFGHPIVARGIAIF
jgi:hypothetical protein